MVEPPKPLPEHVRKRLDEADWKTIYLKLIAHAHSLARSLYWRSANKEDLAEGLGPEDLANEAIARVYEGRRNWDPDKDPDLLKFLKGSVLSSMFNELAMSADNTQTERFPEVAGEQGLVLEPINPAPPEAKHAYHLTRRNPNPEELLQAEEEAKLRELQAKTILNGLLDATKDDPEVTAILECTMEGITAPRHIAERTKIPVEKVNNAQKRLRLLMKKVRPAQ